MKASRAAMIISYLRQAAVPDGAAMPDSQLLRRYATLRDEAAFAALVRRHGPMVLGVCRRTIGHAQDAEDAFQAAFLVLARKAAQAARLRAVGGWLHGVAYRAALDVKRRVARRRAKEHQVENMPHPAVKAEEGQSELLALLDRELTRLPEKYRLPVVLCELEDRSRKEAARQLGLPEGTLSSRLDRARKMLAKRMAAYRPEAADMPLTALFASQAGAVYVPAPLIASTVRVAGGVVSAGIVALAEGVLKAMLLTKIKGAALVLLLAASIGVGGVTLTYRTATAQSVPKPPSAAQTQDRLTALTVPPEKFDLEALRLEVEALRAGLQATRERVKGLEAEVNALKAARPGGGANLQPQTGDPKKPATAAEEALSVIAVPMATPAPAPAPPAKTTPPQALPGSGSAAVTPPSVKSPPTATKGPGPSSFPGGVKGNDGAEARPGEPFGPPTPGGLPAGEGADATATVRNAAARLRNDPTNRKAQEALKSAIEELNRQTEPGPGGF